MQRDTEFQILRRRVDSLSTLSGGGATLSNTAPQALGTASAGSSTSASRADHVHPIPPASLISGLATVAKTGSYTDLSNKPTIPSYTSQLVNDSGFVTSSGSGSSVLSTSNFTVHLASGITLGAYSNNSVIPANTALDSVVRNMLTQSTAATYNQPSVSISTNATLQVEYGSTVNATINLNFYQGDAGNATGYSILMDGSQVSTSSSYSYYISQLVSTHQFTGSVSYAAGVQKYDNLGNPSGSPISAGTKYDTSGVTFQALRAMFYGGISSSPTSSSLVRSLGSPDISGSSSISFYAGPGTSGIAIALPNGRTITGANYVQNGTTTTLPVSNFQSSSVAVNGANGSSASSYNVYFLAILGGLGNGSTFNITTT